MTVSASGTVTKRMLELYQKLGPAPLMFMSGFFGSPARNFHNTEKIELDIVRGDEEVAVAVQDLSTGHRMNTAEIYTTKEFTPPIFKEGLPINSHDLLKRMPGNDPFKDPSFRADLVERVMMGMVKVERKIRRAIELQASQVLQTGVATLIDSAGNTIFNIDYKPKSTHLVTAGVSWATATAAQKLDGISALAEVIRNNGLEDPDQLICGISAFESLLQDEDIRARFDNRRIDLGSLGMGQPRGNGGTFQGRLQIGHYIYDVWTYGGRYKHPQTGVKTPYLHPGKIVVRSSGGRLDATFGAIPNIGRLLGANGTFNILPEVSGRMSNSAGSMDLYTNTWLTEDGEQLLAGVGARPLMIPTAIDTFGCLDTQLT